MKKKVLFILMVFFIGCSESEVSLKDAFEKKAFSGNDFKVFFDSKIKKDWKQDYVFNEVADDKNVEISLIESGDYQEKTEIMCEEGEECDDKDPCTFNDKCVNGVCTGEKYTCDDGLICTEDVCTGDGECKFPLKNGFCLIDGRCYKEGEVSEDNPCVECITSVSTSSFTNDDTNFCKEPDICTVYVCENGECVGKPKDCDDDNPCTEDSCSEVSGCVYYPKDGSCDDGNVCTIGDFCFAGKCIAGKKLIDCDDGNPCTDDYCDPKKGCVHKPNKNSCDDGNLCTTNDHCENGACTGEDVSCDDGNPCTDDLCYPEIGCFHKDNNDPCDDGNACTVGDFCVGGVCVSGTKQLDCNDDNPCTIDFCKEGVGCVHENSYAPCDDGDVCTIGDYCVDGECKPGKYKISCYDANPCTDDICDPVLGCTYPPNEAPCDDGNICTINDKCKDGVCFPGEERLDCDDGNPCTNDYCDPVTGCYHTNNFAYCEDEDPCTLDDYCVNGKCVSGDVPAICDDYNECTEDSCEPIKGCVFKPIDGKPCDDHNVCTTKDMCLNGVCTGMSEMYCNDGNPCTKDYCDPYNGCSVAPTGDEECKAKLVITYPERGSTIYPEENESVTVKGYVKLPAAPLFTLNINNNYVIPDENGNFSFKLKVKQGLNILNAILKDKIFQIDEHLQTFQVSYKYYKNEEAVKDGAGFLIGGNLIDDGDRSDFDDLTTFIYYYLKDLDLKSMVPNPASSGKFLHCKYKIYITDITYSPIGDTDISMSVGEDALYVKMFLKNIKVNFKVSISGLLCPGGTSGEVTVESLEINMGFMPKVDSDGNVSVDIVKEEVIMNGFNISVDNWFYDLILGFFEGMIEDYIYKAIKDAIKEEIPKVLAQYVDAFKINQSFEFNLPFGNDKKITVDLEAYPSSFFIVPYSFLGAGMAINVSSGEKGTPYDILGSIGHAHCIVKDYEDNKVEVEPNYDFAMFLWVDAINKVMYSAYYSGILELDITPDMIPGMEEGSGLPGIEIKKLHVSFMLPPIISGCNSEYKPKLEIGDIKVLATIVFAEAEINMELYLTVVGDIVAQISKDEEGKFGITLGVYKFSFVDYEVASISSDIPGMEGTIIELMDSAVIPLMLDSLGNSLVFNFEIPEVDLSGVIPDLNQNLKLKILPDDLIFNSSGNFIIGGKVEINE